MSILARKAESPTKRAALGRWHQLALMWTYANRMKRHLGNDSIFVLPLGKQIIHRRLVFSGSLVV